MANATVSNLGQINGAGLTDALFLKMFSGEVLAAYKKGVVAAERTRTRTISHGKSA